MNTDRVETIKHLNRVVSNAVDILESVKETLLISDVMGREVQLQLLMIEVNKFLVERSNEYVTGVGQILVNIHSKDQCKSGNCVIHNPSIHEMLSWPTLFREEGLMERVCEHGVGHPDPDSLAFFESQGIKNMGIHGCDGCCTSDGLSKIKETKKGT